MATKSKKLTLKEKIDAWVEQNPLRIFRKKENLTFPELATVMGVSIYTLQLWEHGSNQPRPKHLEKLAAATGDPRFAEKLEAWRRKNPLA